MTTPPSDDDLRRLVREAHAGERPAPPFSGVIAPRPRATFPRGPAFAALGAAGAAVALAVLAPRADVAPRPRLAATASPRPYLPIADDWSVPTDVLLPEEAADDERRVDSLSRAITALLRP